MEASPDPKQLTSPQSQLHNIGHILQQFQSQHNGPSKPLTQSKDENQQLVVFRFRRPVNETPEQQFIVSDAPKKKRKVQTVGQCEQDLLCKQLMEKLQIVVKQQQQKQLKSTKVSSKENNLDGKEKVQFYLTRINGKEDQIFSGPSTLVHSNRFSFHDKVEDFINQKRRKTREQKFNKLRGMIRSDEKQKIKFIDLGKKNVVDFGNGHQFEYEDFSECYDQHQMTDEYYIMEKRTYFKNGKYINLPEQAQKYLQTQKFDDQMEQEVQSNNDSDDSNRESNPDYDYPEEDFDYERQDDNSNEDEGVLYRDEYPSEDSEGEHLDEEQLYRNYRRRCNRKDSSDSDVQYYPV